MIKTGRNLYHILFLIITLSAFGICGTARASQTNRRVLSNGLTVLTRKIPDSTAVSVCMVYRVGSRNEKPGINGISHLLEHILYKNTKNFPKGRMARILTQAGSDFNAFTTSDVTGFHQTMAPDYLELALKIEADRMTSALINKSIIDIEKSIIVAELEALNSKPEYTLWKNMIATAFIHHPYMWAVQGNVADVKKLSENQLKWYYRTWYRPDNAVLVVVGNFDGKKLDTLVKKLFLPIKNPATPLTGVTVTEPPQIEEKNISMSDSGSTPLLYVAYHSPAVSEKDIYAFAVIDAILTSGRSSRLYQGLTDKGLIINMGAWLDTNKDPGLYHIRTTPVKTEYFDRIQTIIQDEVESLKTRPVSAQELIRAKNQLKAQIIKAGDSITHQAQYLAWYEGIYTYGYWDDYLKNIDGVTADDVMATAQKYLTGQNRITGKLSPRQASENKENEDSVRDDNTGSNIDRSKTDGAMLTMAFLNGDGIQISANTKKKTTAKKKSTVKKKKTFKKKTVSKKKNTSKKKTASNKKNKKKNVSKKKTTSKNKKKTASKKKTVAKKKTVKKTYRPETANKQVEKNTVSIKSIGTAKPFKLSSKRYQLPNGAVLLVNINRLNPSVTVQCSLMAGGMYESIDKAGLSKLTSDLILKGSDGLTEDQLFSNLENLGASIETANNLQTVEIRLWAPAENLEQTIPYLAKVITGPVFSPAEMEKAKKIQLRKIAIMDNNPGNVALKEFFAQVFPENHPFHHFSWGTGKTVSGITANDAIDFYRRNYRPDTAIFAVSGDVEPDRVREVFEREFSEWKATAEKTPIIMPSVSLNRTQAVEKSFPRLKRAEIIMGHIGPSRNHPDYYKFYVMNHILGGGPLMTRLGREIRDRGLAYKINSRLNPSISDGPWAVSVETDPENVNKVISAIKAQIKKLQDSPVAEEELQLAKDSILGNLPVAMSSSENVCRELTTTEYYRLPDDHTEKYHEFIRGITRKDIQETARKHLNIDKMNTVICLPR